MLKSALVMRGKHEEVVEEGEDMMEEDAKSLGEKEEKPKKLPRRHSEQ